MKRIYLTTFLLFGFTALALVVAPTIASARQNGSYICPETGKKGKRMDCPSAARAQMPDPKAKSHRNN